MNDNDDDVCTPAVTTTGRLIPRPGGNTHWINECPIPAPVGVQFCPPIVTVAASEKLDPSNVMVVPPVVGPELGLTDEIAGAAYENDCAAVADNVPTVMTMGKLTP